MLSLFYIHILLISLDLYKQEEEIKYMDSVLLGTGGKLQ